MSTTFDILPNIETRPTRLEIIKLSEAMLKIYFHKHNISLEEKMSYKIDRIYQNISNNFQQGSPMDLTYFSLDSIAGEVEVQFGKVDTLIREIWEDEIEDKKPSEEITKRIRKGLDIGHYWCVKKWGNQSVIYDLVHGVVASSLAKLTEGIVNSDDGAWDPSTLPIDADNFVESYLNPEAPVTTEYHQLSMLLIEQLQ